MEPTHLSIRRYTQPDGQVVPLLQVAPSKIDAERVFPISPELAHVFAQIIERVRGVHATVPLCPRTTPWNAPGDHRCRTCSSARPAAPTRYQPRPRSATG